MKISHAWLDALYHQSYHAMSYIFLAQIVYWCNFIRSAFHYYQYSFFGSRGSVWPSSILMPFSVGADGAGEVGVVPQSDEQPRVGN